MPLTEKWIVNLQKITGEVWQVDDEKLQLHLSDMWPVRTSVRRFMGANPVSIERRHFGQLAAETYYVTEKSDGVRFLMYCTRFEGEDVVVLVNRRMQTYVTQADVPAKLYDGQGQFPTKGTILDGELATDVQTDRSVFLVFDGVVVGGTPVHHRPFCHRMIAVADALGPIPGRDDHVSLKEKYGLGVRIKHFFSLHKAWPVFMRHYDEANRTFNTDGIILVPNSCGVRTGRHEGMFKCKPAEQNTVDLEVVEFGGRRCLGIYSHRRRELYSVNAVPPTTVDMHLEIGQIVECKYEKGVWHPLLVRTDKDTPNDSITLERTLVNISEAIGMHEFSRFSVPHLPKP